MAQSGPFTQDNRFLSLTTPQGKDVLLLNSFSVSERISAPYRIDLDVLTDENTKVEATSLLGKPVSFSAAYGDLTRSKRYFHGIVSDQYFDKVIVLDPLTKTVDIDNLYFGTVPAPGPIPLLATLLAMRHRRRA